MTDEEALAVLEKNKKTMPCVLCGALPCVTHGYVEPDDVGLSWNTPEERDTKYFYFLCSTCAPYTEGDRGVVAALVKAKMKVALQDITWSVEPKET